MMKLKNMRKIFLIVLAVFVLTPSPVSVYAVDKLDYDLEVQGGNIYFSKSVLVANDKVRIYALVRNVGNNDMSAKVAFYQGDQKIGDSESVSIRANGLDDEVFVDWTVPNGAFNIRAELINFGPQTDQNTKNNVALTPVIIPLKDDDKDTVINDKDNCVSVANTDQLDTDGDKVGNACDADDDNDGVLDTEDAFPLDPSKFKNTTPTPTPTPKPKPTPTPTPKPTPVPTPVPDPIKTSTEDTTVKKEPLYCETNEDCASIIDKSKSCEAEVNCVNHTCELKCKEPASDTSPLDALEKDGLTLVIDVAKQDWNRYLFTPILGNKHGDRVTFAWDFGDGVTSTFSNPIHTYRRWGNYTVTLNVRDNYGNNVVKSAEINISFFNPGNWMLWVVMSIIILGVLMTAWWFTNGFLFKNRFRRSHSASIDSKNEEKHTKTSVKVKEE